MYVVGKLRSSKVTNSHRYPHFFGMGWSTVVGKFGYLVRVIWSFLSHQLPCRRQNSTPFTSIGGGWESGLVHAKSMYSWHFTSKPLRYIYSLIQLLYVIIMEQSSYISLERLMVEDVLTKNIDMVVSYLYDLVTDQHITIKYNK